MKKEEIVCPKCYSNQINANQRGFNTTTGALGLVTSGAMSGIAYGSLGSGKTIITCLQCGNKFEPGNGALKSIDELGNETIVYLKKKKSYTKNIILLSILALIIWFCYVLFTDPMYFIDMIHS